MLFNAEKVEEDELEVQILEFNTMTEKKRYEWLVYSNNKLGVFN